MDNCQNCAFLKKESINIPGHRSSRSWPKEDRERLEVIAIGDETIASSCYKGLWDQGVDQSTPLREILSRDRKNQCFFLDYRRIDDSMLFKGAEILETPLTRLIHESEQDSVFGSRKCCGEGEIVE